MCPAFARCKLQTYRIEKQKDRTRKRKKEQETMVEKGERIGSRKRNKEKGQDG